MSEPQFYEATWNEDGTAKVKARLTRENDSYNIVPLLQANVTSITRAVYILDTGVLVIGPTTLSAASCILDTVSTGTGWTQDDADAPGEDGLYGFNFYDTIPITAFPDGDEEYVVEYTFTLTSGEVFPLRIKGTAVRVFGS